MSTEGGIEIILDNKRSVYYTGDTITGKVSVKTEEKIISKGVILNLYGDATVAWSETVPDTLSSFSIRQPIRRASHTDNKWIHFKDSKSVYRVSQLLSGNDLTEVEIPPGEKIYTFSIHIPEFLPCSFVSQHGKIEYVLEATYFRKWKVDFKAKVVILVATVVDLSTFPEASERGLWSGTETMFGIAQCCCFKPRVVILVFLETRGFYPGDDIPFKVKISNKDIPSISAELVARTTFFAMGKYKEAINTLVKITIGDGLLGKTECWEDDIRIPEIQIPPSNLGGCKLIDMEYFLKIVGHMNSYDLEVLCPIYIGALPEKPLSCIVTDDSKFK